MKHVDVIEIAGVAVPVGTQVSIEIPIGELPTKTQVHMRAEVIRGKEPGPVVWISSCVHGDELNGVEIARQVLRKLKPENLKGTIIIVPVVNVYGFNQEMRYLPDRRDLNRSFPGAKRGSMAARLANTFMSEIVVKCDLGIDLHTAAKGRYNLPQLRGDISDPFMRTLAEAFAAPIFIEGKPPAKSLRGAANNLNIPVVLYEAGEADRLGLRSIQIGVIGVMRALQSLEMVKDAPEAITKQLLLSSSTKWVRARRSGLLRLDVSTGDLVEKKQKLGVIGDAYGDRIYRVEAPTSGLIISHATKPLLNQGDPIVHIANVDTSE